jgi:peptide deformylase
MILPIVAYGDAVLKKVASPIESDQFDEVQVLIDSLFETMYHANGVGLAAPQVGKDIRLFIIDSTQMHDDDSGKGFKLAFLNPEVLEESGPPFVYEEGCLSIPGIRGDVSRPSLLRIKWQGQDGQWQEQVFEGLDARVIQHEYDHIEGILFTDKLSSLRKQLIKGKLAEISKGNVEVDYRMRFPR